VGLIGLGNMGSAIAERLLDAGYSLVVNNRTPEKAQALAALGADVAATPEDLAERVDVVLSSLANDAAFEEVASRVIGRATGAGAGRSEHRLTGAPARRRAGTDGVRSHLRAPVSGNPTVVRAGNLSFIVSGLRETPTTLGVALAATREHPLRRRGRAGSNRSPRST
jgi:3-hydroxyisobutyrate dehydrogenase-like beta-hydroxyacid dehydrogenase